ncbi:MAG: aminopeptidase P family protein [Candidatus Krumholzibacteria bacterium]|nr:aminopeptidase P family protein [Candidatus Krumholzibacteria bacterium]
MNAQHKVVELRKLMKKNKIDAYYVPSADPHMSEYLPDCGKHREWLSGFTGSAGELVIGLRKAGLWTDGRYFLQASIELKDSGISLMKMGEPETPSMPEWVAAQLKKGQVLGVDPTVISVAAAGQFESALAPHGIKVKFLRTNLVGKLWDDRPDASLAPITNHSSKFAGETVGNKMKRVREAMKKAGTKAMVIGALDQIAWMLNIRSADIAYTPVVISYVLLTERGCWLYVDQRKVPKAFSVALKKRATLKAYDAIWNDLKALSKKKQNIWIDPALTNRRVVDELKGSTFHYAMTPIATMKAIKNQVQITGITNAHRRDGVAMVRFLKWLEKAVPKGKVTEISAADQLEAFRAMGEGFKDLSFNTISGYAANGAIIHYGPSEKSNAKLKPQGLYLIDSGGQYPDGTTDITRTIALGKPTPRQIDCFTRVLMGTIDCTVIPFPAGTPGYRNEMFARKALWEIGEDYAHGTGHGVGQYLGVHEGPHSLKNIITPPFVEGNLMSIEPGHYEDGKFGIRIEHLAFVVKHEKFSKNGRTWLTFHPVTLCPIDRRLINKKIMTKSQIEWVNTYHMRCTLELASSLDIEHREWLKKACRPI